MVLNQIIFENNIDHFIINYLTFVIIKIKIKQKKVHIDFITFSYGNNKAHKLIKIFVLFNENSLSINKDTKKNVTKKIKVSKHNNNNNLDQKSKINKSKKR